jgi:hypothetical protein
MKTFAASLGSTFLAFAVPLGAISQGDEMGAAFIEQVEVRGHFPGAHDQPDSTSGASLGRPRKKPGSPRPLDAFDLSAFDTRGRSR